jgi:hypothetical protein
MYEIKIKINQINNQILQLQRSIYDIDNKSIYSLYDYFFDEGEKREELVKQIKWLEKELEYMKDDEKREKYRVIRNKDPLKYGKMKHQ